MLKKAVVFMGGLTLAGCASQDPSMIVSSSPGFWLGVWHGMIAPITLIVNIFNPEVTVFAMPNNGGWYAFGFLTGFGTSVSVSVR